MVLPALRAPSARRRQLGHVALEIPLGLLPLGRGAERDHPADAGAEGFDDPLDDAALAGSVAALENHHDLAAIALDPLL